MKDHNHLFTLRLNTSEGFVIVHAFDGGYNGLQGGNRIDVEVKLKGQTIFKRGDAWCGTPASGGMTIDGIEAKELVLSLINMKPGDTDKEYFDNYTQEQLDFALRLGEEISMIGEYRYCDKNDNVKKKGK